LAIREEALSAENVFLTGDDGEKINAYRVLTGEGGARPGVVVLHHFPGWDSTTKEIARRFAANGYNAMCPNLYAREGFDTDPDDAAAAARAKGGVPDEQLLGDVGGAIDALRALPNSNGKIGIIGYCSGGRQAFLAGLSLPVDAAVDCYGSFVAGTIPEDFHLDMVPLVDRTASLRCPLLGLFGAEDKYPPPDEVAELEAALIFHGKTYELHTYEGVGHAFFASDRPSYRPEAALDGWRRIFSWFDTYLTPSEA
jgi:carboxymethylenebutenolidase